MTRGRRRSHAAPSPRWSPRVPDEGGAQVRRWGRDPSSPTESRALPAVVPATKRVVWLRRRQGRGSSVHLKQNAVHFRKVSVHRFSPPLRDPTQLRIH